MWISSLISPLPDKSPIPTTAKKNDSKKKNKGRKRVQKFSSDEIGFACLFFWGIVRLGPSSTRLKTQIVEVCLICPSFSVIKKKKLLSLLDLTVIPSLFQMLYDIQVGYWHEREKVGIRTQWHMGSCVSSPRKESSWLLMDM